MLPITSCPYKAEDRGIEPLRPFTGDQDLAGLCNTTLPIFQIRLGDFNLSHRQYFIQDTRYFTYLGKTLFFMYHLQ